MDELLLHTILLFASVRTLRLLSLILLLTLIVHCCGCSENRWPNEDCLQYRVRSHDGVTRRITLIPEGGARIDIESRASKCSILIPASAPEIRQIFSELSSIQGSVLVERLHPNLAAWIFRQDEERVIVRWNGKTRLFNVPVGQRAMSYAVEGLLHEIEVVGHMQLADAVSTYESANAKIAAGDRGPAAEDFEATLQSYNAWDSTLSRRYSLGDDLRLVRVVFGSFTLSLTPRVRANFDSAGVAAQSKADDVVFLPIKASADEVMRYIAIKRRASVLIVQFPEAGWRDYLDMSETRGEMSQPDISKLLSLPAFDGGS